jgi:CheY-like chemotaxis protein
MKVLFVEDDEGMAKAVRDALRGKGYTCNIAGLGQQAVELAKSRPYDIIVLDLGLPDMDGFHVIRLLRVEGIDTPVLLQSGLSGPELGPDGVELSENEFLAKPFNISELIERMNEIVARSKAAVEPSAGTPTEKSADSDSGNGQPQDSEEPDELDGRQRRRHARAPLFGSALMIGSDGKPIPCVMVDMSESGCALKLMEGDKECPTLFTLYTEEPKRQWQCELRWRRKDRIGVEFQ